MKCCGDQTNDEINSVMGKKLFVVKEKKKAEKKIPTPLWTACGAEANG